MNRLPDFTPFASRPLAAPAGKAADALSTSNWFDARGEDGAVRISAGLSIASRGLSVDQHAARVLEQLCARPDERA